MRAALFAGVIWIAVLLAVPTGIAIAAQRRRMRYHRIERQAVAGLRREVRSHRRGSR